MWEDGKALEFLEVAFGKTGLEYATEQPPLEGCA